MMTNNHNKIFAHSFNPMHQINSLNTQRPTDTVNCSINRHGCIKHHHNGRIQRSNTPSYIFAVFNYVYALYIVDHLRSGNRTISPGTEMQKLASYTILSKYFILRNKIMNSLSPIVKKDYFFLYLTH